MVIACSHWGIVTTATTATMTVVLNFPTCVVAFISHSKSPTAAMQVSLPNSGHRPATVHRRERCSQMHIAQGDRWDYGFDDYDPYDDEHDLGSSVTRNETAIVTIEDERTLNNREDKPDDDNGELCEIPLGMESGWAKLRRSTLPAWATMPNTCDDDVKNDDTNTAVRVMVDGRRDTTKFFSK
jgi:hypothetical protein